MSDSTGPSRHSAERSSHAAPTFQPRRSGRLARMVDELAMQEYEPGAVVRRFLAPGERRAVGGFRAAELGIHASQGNVEVTVVPCVRNAQVYRDIHNLAQNRTPGATVSSRHLQRFIRQGLAGGRVSVWFRAAVAVAQLRLQKRAVQTGYCDLQRPAGSVQQVDPFLSDLCRRAALNSAVQAMYTRKGCHAPTITPSRGPGAGA